MEHEYNFKIVEADIGFCKIVYSVEYPSGKTGYYCLQQEDEGLPILYTCSDGSYGVYEADTAISFKRGLNIKFEIPKGECNLIKQCENWIILHGYQ